MKVILRISFAILFSLIFAYSGYAADKALYDDFSSGYLDHNKWTFQPASREIINGKLVKYLSSTTERSRFNTLFANPADINSFECKMSIDSVFIDKGNNTRAVAFLGGYFYNADSSSTGSKGDIWADIRLWKDEQGLSVRYYLSQAEDDELNNRTVFYNEETLIPPGIIQVGTIYEIGISYDGNNQFTFWIQGPTSDETASIVVNGPDWVRDNVYQHKGIYLGTNSNSGAGQASISVSIDDVKTGSTSVLFDDFSSEYLSPSKWNAGLFSRTFENEEIRLEVKGFNDSNANKIFWSRLRLAVNDAGYVEAKLQMSSNSEIQLNNANDAVGNVRIAGYYYNDSYNGDFNGYEGNVWVSLRLKLRPDGTLAAESRASRQTEAEQFIEESIEEIHYVFGKTIEFDKEYTCSIEFDGRTFDFTVDDETWSYSLPGNAFKPYMECRYIDSQFWSEPGVQGHITGIVDDVYIDSTTGNFVNQPPLAPGLLYPLNNSTNVSVTTDLAIDNFSDPDTNDTHSKTQWQISPLTNFSTIILSEVSTTHLTSLPVPGLTLEENTTYYWRARVYDNNSNTSEWSESYSFTTVDTQNDQNGNGIPDTLENITADLDGNGTPDIQQTDIKTLNTIIGNAQIGISIKDSATVTSIKEINSIDPDTISLEARPQTMPLGLFGMKLAVENPGDIAEVTIYFSDAVPEEAVWYLYDSINGWTDYSDYATFSLDRKSITVKLKDGDYGDADGAANGTIVDPCGFGIASWLKGCISDATTNQAITTAKIVIEELGISLNCLLDGNFISMLLPGTYDIDVSAPGYQSQTFSNLEISEASIVTQDASLTPITDNGSNNGNTSTTSQCKVKIQGISLSQAPIVNTPVTITANAQDGCNSSIYYRFSVHPDYGTDGYDGLQWTSMTATEYTSNNSIQYTFDKKGKYIVVVWAVADPNEADSQGVAIVGYSVDVGDDECKTNILGCTVTTTQKAYRTITLTANAQNTCGKDLYYRFSIHPDYGTNKYDGLHWSSITDTEWVSENSADYIFTKSGKYIVVVWATEDPENYNPNGIPIIGWSVDIE